MDVFIIREGKKIKSNWYQKPTYSGGLLNFFSHHPLNYQTNVINNLVDRGIILAHITFYNENIQRIKNILLNNNYLINFINQKNVKNQNCLLQKYLKIWNWRHYLLKTRAKRKENCAQSLGVFQQAISKHLKVMGMIQKQGNWVPYELKPRDD